MSEDRPASILRQIYEVDAHTLEQGRQWVKVNRWPAKDSPSQRAKWDQARARDATQICCVDETREQSVCLSTGGCV